MWRGIGIIATRPRTPWDRSVPTNWAFTICRATCLNGVKIGMAVTAVLLRRIRKALPPVHVVCCVGAVVAVLRGTAASRAASATPPTAGSIAAGCASPSTVYNEDLLRRKRRTQNARKYAEKTESVPPDMPGGTLSV